MKQEKENYCLCRFLNEKKRVYLIIESFRIKTVQEVAQNPSVETISYREKSWKQACTHSDTVTHAHTYTLTNTPRHVDMEAAEEPKSKKK